jgi:hypothetical protein
MLRLLRIWGFGDKSQVEVQRSDQQNDARHLQKLLDGDLLVPAQPKRKVVQRSETHQRAQTFEANRTGYENHAGGKDGQAGLARQPQHEPDQASSDQGEET